MQFQIQTVSRTPIYLQLATQIREAIARGDLKPGDKLPSVRQLSRDLVINPNTVAKVYAELERDGILVGRPGLGAFVAPPSDDLTSEARQRKLNVLIDQLLTEAVHLGFTSREVQRMVKERAGAFAWPKPGRDQRLEARG
jgi:GntR family transcriptional regulator